MIFNELVKFDSEQCREWPDSHTKRSWKNKNKKDRKVALNVTCAQIMRSFMFYKLTVC